MSVWYALNKDFLLNPLRKFLCRFGKLHTFCAGDTVQRRWNNKNEAGKQNGEMER